MPRPILDLVGHRYGRLLVLGMAERKAGNANWRCRCDCGRETVVRGGNLRNGNTRSCGHCGLYERKIRTDERERTPTYSQLRRQIHDRIAALRDKVDEIKIASYPHDAKITDAITYLMAAYRDMLWDSFERSNENCDRAEACIKNIMHGDTQQREMPLEQSVGAK